MGRVKVMGRVRVRVLEGAVVPTVIIRVTHIVFIAGGRRELDESSRVWPTFRALGGTVEASQLMLGSERRRPESTIICAVVKSTGCIPRTLERSEGNHVDGHGGGPTCTIQEFKDSRIQGHGGGP